MYDVLLTARIRNSDLRHVFRRYLEQQFSVQMMPNHVIPSEFFSILPFDDFKDSEGKQGSIVTM